MIESKMGKSLMSAIVLLGGMLASNVSGFAQPECSGVYFTADQYLKKELVYSTDCEKDKQVINTFPLFNSKSIIILRNGKKFRHRKDSVYAIQYKNGSIVRIFNNEEYPLMNPNEKILIYKSTYNRESKYGSGKVTRYYFSKDAKSKILDLTKANVKAAFPGNQKFTEFIDSEFVSNESLAAYDDTVKMMKLNQFLQNSLKPD